MDGLESSEEAGRGTKRDAHQISEIWDRSPVHTTWSLDRDLGSGLGKCQLNSGFY